MRTHWKYSSSLRNFSASKSRILLSPARKRTIDPSPKRKIILNSKTRKPNTNQISPQIESTQKNSAPELFPHSVYFTPKLRPYIELSQSPSPYDLRGQSIQKDINSIQQLLNFSDSSAKTLNLTKDYKKLTKKNIRKLENERESLLDLNLEPKSSHFKAKDFFYHVKRGEEEAVITLLVNFPVLVKEVDSTGQTALHWAVRRQNISLIKFLLSCNINVMVKDIVGRRAEDIARHKGLNAISDLLIAARRRTAYSSKILTANGDSAFFAYSQLNSLKVRKSKLINE